MVRKGNNWGAGAGLYRALSEDKRPQLPERGLVLRQCLLRGYYRTKLRSLARCC